MAALPSPWLVALELLARLPARRLEATVVSAVAVGKTMGTSLGKDGEKPWENVANVVENVEKPWETVENVEKPWENVEMK